MNVARGIWQKRADPHIDPIIPYMNPDPLSQYQEREKIFSAELEACRLGANRLSNIRLAVALVAFGGFLWFVFQNQVLPALITLGIGIITFIILVVRHEKILTRKLHSAKLLGLNEAGIQRISGHWTKFPVNGSEFVNDGHAYTSDLDVFGAASLYQWMNTTQTTLGRIHLQRLLTEPPRALEQIVADQARVKELAVKLDWRQRFQAAGGSPPAPKRKEDPETLLSWAESKTEIFAHPNLATALRCLPIFSFAFAMYSFFGLNSTALMVPPFLINMAIAAWIHRRHGNLLGAINERKKELEIYLDLLHLAETADFSNPALQSLSRTLRNPQGTLASIAVRRLQKLADHLETRLNPIINFLVNTLFLWDLQWLCAYRRWRNENGAHLRIWLETIARLETLSSLSVPAFENPDWVFPELGEGEPLFESQLMAHPLIPKGVRVGNDLRLGKAGEILIITGSNMSGKSTLMRTVGINLVLAFAGAPVCARSFRCTPVELHTSMRLKDDLEKRISSFYSELLRIKGIVEAARQGKKVLFLVDEIFRGTNSKDRHQGAMTVLRQLHLLGAAGLVSTHDLELAELESMDPEFFRNHHFQESYSNGIINFDYKMVSGVSQTTNAIHLIRMVGLGE